MDLNHNYSSKNPKSASSSIIRKPSSHHAPTLTQIAHPCTECGKKFSSWKALFGHMRCHPERQWRGIKPPAHLRPLRPHPNDDEVASCLLMLANGSPAAVDHGPLLPNLDDAHVNQLGTPPLPQESCCCSYPYAERHHHHYHQNMVDPAGLINYGRFECSGCKKVFDSHQALGGHRASHKNVKGCFAITKKSEVDDKGGGDQQHNYAENVHKCSICLRVFSSGQALGGHMRCHWEKKVDEDQSMEPSSSRVISNYTAAFDLNLPAPIQDDAEDDYTHNYGNLDLRLGV